jgi:hypothetical protein
MLNIWFFFEDEGTSFTLDIEQEINLCVFTFILHLQLVNWMKDDFYLNAR